LCERCLRNGIVRAGRIVHHKIHLDADNIGDPNVTLNWDNLELVCMDCHAAEHGSKKRYKVDLMGNVQAK
jgi:5-methylcytosine-specific restriction endonuclease McrA